MKITTRRDKECTHCNKKFTCYKSRFETAKYCSKDCQNKARETHEIRICIICGNNFKCFLSIQVGKYCSRQCSGKGRRILRKKKNCLVCKSEFIPSKTFKQKKFCSRICSSINQSEKTFYKIASEEQILNKLKKTLEDNVIKLKNGCWEWTRGSGVGYGSMHFKGKTARVHRISYMYHNNDWGLSSTIYICHTCDNKICFSPEHLFKGTPLDNTSDMIKKGRTNYPKGENASGAKMSNETALKVKRLLKLNMKMTDIAKMLNIKKDVVNSIKRRRSWKHINS